MPKLELAFREAESPFHRMTPSSKLLYIIGVSFIAIFNTNLYVAIGLFLFTLFIAAFFTKVSLRTYWSLGKVILPFIIILMVVFPFFYGGQATTGSEEVAFRTPLRDLTWADLGFGWLLALRFMALGIAGLTFAFTTHPSDMVQNLSKRGWDYRLVHAPVLGLVLFPAFIEMGREISITQRIRDLGQNTNFIKRKWVRMKHLAFALLVLGLRNGQTQAMALDIRGYGAHKTRTFMRPAPHSRAGTIFGWAFFIFSIIYLIVVWDPLTMQWNMDFS